jgi:hypothetical protein
MSLHNGQVDPAAVKQSLLGTIKPLEDHLETIDAAIAEAEAELAELRDLRKMVGRMIAVADPEHPSAANRPGPRAGVKSGGPKRDKSHVSDATLVMMRRAIDEHRAEFAEGFQLRDIGAYVTVHPSTITKALVSLADEGFVRLDRIGAKGARIYKRNIAERTLAEQVG